MMELKRGISKQRCRTAHINGNRSNMYATFSKRLRGLFIKAGELSEISGCEIAILVLSEDGRPQSFAAGPGNPTVHQILESYTPILVDSSVLQHRTSYVSPSPRDATIFSKKSGELSKLCYCQIAILVLPPTLGGRPYCFSTGPHYPSFSDIVRAYLAAPTTSTPRSFSSSTDYPAPSSRNFMCQGASPSSNDMLSVDHNAISLSHLKII